MKTLYLLLAQYDGKTVVPVDLVCRDFFSHLTPDMLCRKVGSGEIKLPIMRIEASQKAARGVHIVDLAEYLNESLSEAKAVHAADPMILRQNSVALDQIRKMPRFDFERSSRGIYFLFDGDVCVYVGQSFNVHARVVNHAKATKGKKKYSTPIRGFMCRTGTCLT